MRNDLYQMPVSFAQRRMWLFEQFSPSGTVDIVACRLTIDGPVDPVVLEAALSAVVARQDALRTTFHTVDGEPVQVVAPPGPTPIRYEDLPTATDADARVSALAGEPFDLETGPLLRALLLRVATDGYELILTTHRIVADLRSIELICAELATAYSALVVGAQPNLPDLPMRYEDVARHVAAPANESYWRDVLDGVPDVITLPTDRPRPPEQAGFAGVVEFDIDAATGDGLRAIARDCGGTLDNVLLSAYAVVLSRYSGRTDVLVGLPVDRRIDGTEHLIGPFVDTMPVRVRTDDDPAFATLVERVRATVADGTARRDVPFDRIVEIAGATRALSHAPLVQVSFAVDRTLPPISAGPVTFRPALLDNDVSTDDLALTVRDTGTTVFGRLTYDTELFDAGTVASIVDALIATARAVADDPRIPVSAIVPMTPGTRARILGEWGSGPALTAPDDLVELLLGALNGDAAVIAGDTSLAGPDLVEWSGQIAAALVAAGVGPESMVGLCLPRGVALVPAMLGVWMAGAAYVPLDPGYPAGRLRMMAEDSGIRVVLTQSSLAGLVRGMVGGGVTVVRVDAPDLRNDAPLEPIPVPGEALAYTIFTSGSTGRPKGVAVPRVAVAAMLRAFESTIGMTEDDVWVAVTTLSFDIAVLELLLPLLVGASVVVADAATAADGGLLRRLLQTSGATVLQATPATWRMLGAVGGVPAPVRLRLCGGEAVPPDLVDLLTSDGAAAWNVYGPTETTVWSAAGRIAPSPAPVVVGPPIPGTRLLVLDDDLRLVPPGAVGELYIAGAGMTRGYFGRPDLTAERFLPDPYAEDGGGRMYRTGDLARWRSDGLLDLLGRVDHQVKVRGFRIETGEIEAVLGRHASVAHAVVTAQSGNLVAYVVPREGTADFAALRRHLQGFVPDYMIPAAFVVLDDLPLTPNGKVDRARLPQPEWGDNDTVEYVPPATPMQERLVEMWADLLPDVKQIGIHHNFFALGGHSLVAIRLTSRLQAEYGVKLTLRTLFSHATVGDLATVIESEVVALN